MRKFVAIAGAVLGAMAFAVTPAGPAGAAVPSAPAAMDAGFVATERSEVVAENQNGGWLEIMITPLGTDSGSVGTPTMVTLTCDPVGGSHPNGVLACKDIAAAAGDIAAIPPQPNMACLPVWDPVEVSVWGIWDEQFIDYSDTVSDLGCARVSHGQVFNLDPLVTPTGLWR